MRHADAGVCVCGVVGEEYFHERFLQYPCWQRCGEKRNCISIHLRAVPSSHIQIEVRLGRQQSVAVAVSRSFFNPLLVNRYPDDLPFRLVAPVEVARQ